MCKLSKKTGNIAPLAPEDMCCTPAASCTVPIQESQADGSPEKKEDVERGACGLHSRAVVDVAFQNFVSFLLERMKTFRGILSKPSMVSTF